MTAPRVARITTSGGPRIADQRALPRVKIDTVGGAPILTTTDYVSATFTLAGSANYTGTAKIRGRGNSTWTTPPKKPYRIKLDATAPLLGMPTDRDWVLLANWYDPLRLRGTVAFEIANRVGGTAWVPKTRLVEVTLNGDPRGLYQLGEHVKIAPHRIPITAMSASDTTGLAVTGGYTAQFDANDPTTFTTAHDGLNVVMDDPDGSVPAQVDYFHAHLDAFEAALYGSSWLDPAAGYARFVDMQSFVGWYLTEELCANSDSRFFKSCKFFKARDTASGLGRLSMGPVWDFDASLSTAWVGDAAQVGGRPAAGFYTRTGATWINRMCSDPAFVAVLRARWTALKTSLELPGAQGINGYIDSLVKVQSIAHARDASRWTNIADAATAAADIKAWLTARVAWLDANLPS